MLIELQFDVIPIQENVIGYDMLHGYDNFHINYNVTEKDLKENKEKILNEICYSIRNNYQIPVEVKEADIIVILDRKTRRVLKIINNNYIKKEELKQLIKIDNIDYLHYILKSLVEE